MASKIEDALEALAMLMPVTQIVPDPFRVLTPKVDDARAEHAALLARLEAAEKVCESADLWVSHREIKKGYLTDAVDAWRKLKDGK